MIARQLDGDVDAIPYVDESDQVEKGGQLLIAELLSCGRPHDLIDPLAISETSHGLRQVECGTFSFIESRRLSPTGQRIQLGLIDTRLPCPV